MDRYDREAFPHLRSMLRAYGPYCEEDSLDSDAPAEAATFWWPDEALNEWRSELDRLLPELDSRDAQEQDIYMRQQMALPASDSYSNWFRYLEAHIAGFYPHRKPQTIAGDGMTPPRASRFTDKETANHAATDVLKAHESTLRAWAAEHDGTYRLHLYAELGRPVGHYLLPDEAAAYRDSGQSPELEPTRYEARGCVVLIRRQHDTGKPYVAAAYPEKALDTRPRERFPDLSLLFGGYWGQDFASLDNDRWAAERNFNSSTADAVRERVAHQLTQLLEVDDETLRNSLESLGSYTLPNAARRWVIGLHRRMTQLHWRRE